MDMIITQQPNDTLHTKKPPYDVLDYQKWTQPSHMMKLPPSSKSIYELLGVRAYP